MIDISKFVSRRPRVCEPSTRTKQQARMIKISNAKDKLANLILNNIANEYKVNPETDIIATQISVDDDLINCLGLSLAQIEDIASNPIQGISLEFTAYETFEMDGVYSEHLRSMVFSPSRAGWRAIASELDKPIDWAKSMYSKAKNITYKYGGFLE